MTTKKTPRPPQEIADPVIPSNTDPAPQFGVQGTTVWSHPTASNGKPNLARALAAAQAECKNVTFNKVNPHFKSKYADFAAVRDAVIPVFTKHGLSIVQAPTTDNYAGFCLETRLLHVSGEELVWMYPLPTDMNKPQAIGSAISYARRYTLGSIAAIASEEDDDANAAQNPNGGGYAGAYGGGAAGGGRAPAGGNPPPANGGIEL